MHYPAESHPEASAQSVGVGHQQKQRWPRRRLQAWHVAGMVLLVVVGGLLLYGFWPVLMGGVDEEERPDVGDAEAGMAQVEAVEVNAVEFPLRAEATGYLSPWRRTKVSPEITGKVVSRPIEEGRRVEAGALLFALDDEEHRIEMDESEAELLRTRADFAVRLGRDENFLPADTSFLTQERLAWEEAQHDHAAGTISDGALRDARRRADAAHVLTGEQRGAVQAATAGLAQAEQRVERARLALDRTRITAPFAGRVADLDIEEGQRVGAGEETVLLLDDSRMKVDVDVLEDDLVRMEEGATARVRLPSMDNRVFEGTVHAINPRIDPGRGTGRVTVVIPNPDGRLLSGLYAYVELETERLAGRLVVPADAVLVRQGRDLVFRINDGRAEWVYVETGARSGDYVEITDGLDAGDTVATYGHHELAHDARVEIGAIHNVFE